MLAFIFNFIFIFAEGGHSGGDGFYSKVEPYLNYPGFEAWKFINLGIFVALMVYLIKKPLTEAFKAKRETIRAELIKAEEEKQAALAQLTSTEAKLINLEAEKAAVLERAEAEAIAEKTRIADQTEFEVNRLREQTANEIALLSRQAKADLRRFSAEESIRLAEEKLKSQMSAEKDASLVKAGIKAIGGLN
jgi:F-type H+-transporting ATPase subunit b